MNLRKLFSLICLLLFLAVTGRADDSSSNTITVGEPVTTVTEGWYILHNVNRGNYAYDNGNEYKMGG